MGTEGEKGSYSLVDSAHCRALGGSIPRLSDRRTRCSEIFRDVNSSGPDRIVIVGDVSRAQI